MKNSALRWHGIRVTSLQVLALLLIALVFGALGLMLRSDGAEPERGQPGAIGSWARDYRSVSDLLKEPDSIAIVGQVVETGKPYFVGGDANETGAPFTDAIIEVSDVLAGQLRAELDGEVVVRQTGAASGPDAFELQDARLLRKDEQVLLFLTYDAQFEKYSITGGKHGFFTIESGGEVRSANLTSDHPLSEFVSGRSIQQVSEDVSRVASETP